uniref:Uncharacterized protein n=1 Tax=Setaria viridis TaxID=4556 RepID=A0A4U6THX7_SETVI|nr:hypothetical protein SEVIR_8G090600v2 [Setaria viridis]TKW00179.1 hypothetical protein SEVIR_8G090600v2 [Setaria viridis]
MPLLHIEVDRGLRQWIEIGRSGSRCLVVFHAEELEMGRGSTTACAQAARRFAGALSMLLTRNPVPWWMEHGLQEDISNSSGLQCLPISPYFPHNPIYRRVSILIHPVHFVCMPATSACR